VTADLLGRLAARAQASAGGLRPRTASRFEGPATTAPVRPAAGGRIDEEPGGRPALGADRTGGEPAPAADAAWRRAPGEAGAPDVGASEPPRARPDAAAAPPPGRRISPRRPRAPGGGTSPATPPGSGAAAAPHLRPAAAERSRPSRTPAPVPSAPPSPSGDPRARAAPLPAVPGAEGAPPTPAGSAPGPREPLLPSRPKVSPASHQPPVAGPRRGAAAPPETVIRVTIGRVDVRAVPPARPPAREARAAPQPRLTLEGYLERRRGGRR